MVNPRYLLAILAFLTCISTAVFLFEHFLQEELVNKQLFQESQVARQKSRASEFFYQVIGNVPDFESKRTQTKLSNTGEIFEQYTLEVDVRETQGEAENLLDTLRKDGVVAYYTPIHVGEKVIYRVRKGAYPTKKLASAAKASMLTKHGIDTKVIKLQ